MKHLLPVALMLAAVSCQSNDKSVATAADPNAEAAVRQRVEQFEKLYSHKDEAGVLALVDPDSDVMLGTDSAEVNVGKAAIAQQMKDDFATTDSLRFGTMTNFHGVSSPTLATAFYDSPLTAYNGGRGYHGLVRIATVWRKRDDGQWYLTQTLISQPSKGRSSHEMALARQKKAAAK